MLQKKTSLRIIENKSSEQVTMDAKYEHYLEIRNFGPKAVFVVMFAS